ncbi:MAG: glycosyltransferase [Woeseiaceae bacterium]|jgi:glycosyltransferase involved in cell wall biosynthesis|nr:glycosyltransferase [Woeseiaceae bacterium]
MSNPTPLVSIYITTFNRCLLLERALNSVLSQTYTNIEVLIIDDASTDGSKEYVNKNFNDSRVQYFLLPENKGACHARNIGINQAKGEFITGLDSDDTFETWHIHALLLQFNSARSFICTTYSNSQDTSGIYDSDDLIWDNVAGNQFFALRSRVQATLFDEHLESAQDLDIMLRLSLNFGVFEKFHNQSYALDTSSSISRISTSTNKILGLRKFYSKHCGLMTNRQKFYWKILLQKWQVRRFTIFFNTLLSILRPQKLLQKFSL